jgi:hypothetical protein
MRPETCLDLWGCLGRDAQLALPSALGESTAGGFVVCAHNIYSSSFYAFTKLLFYFALVCEAYNQPGPAAIRGQHERSLAVQRLRSPLRSQALSGSSQDRSLNRAEVPAV